MDRLRKYCEGGLSAEDERMMRDYLTEHGTDADVSECLGEIFDSIGESDAAEGEKAYFKAAAALGIDRPVTRKRHRAVSWFAGIAASLAVLIAGGATALLVDGSRDVEWNEIKVPAGQTRELVLADGTVLQLNAGSRVTYPASFRRCRTREIFAEGEIYAEVAKDPKHPFFINSGDVGVKVLGTKFNFKAYGDSRCVELLLFEGAVEFGIMSGKEIQSGVALKPGDMVQYDRENGDVGIKSFSKNDFRPFSQGGAIHFFDISLEDIVLDLQRIFDVRIVIADPQLAQKRYFAYFANGESLMEILSSLDSEIDIYQKDNIIFLQ